MKDKHLQIRVQQCLLLAQASNCPRRKFGALLLDPDRNVVLMDGYNGGPRGGGAMCMGGWCIREGAPEPPSAYRVQAQRTEDGSHRWDLLVQHTYQVTLPPTEGPLGPIKDAAICAFKEAHPSIPSGTQIELGCHHAEMNVICNAAAGGVATAGAWLIVTGEPCLLCSKLIHHAGIVQVLCIEGGYKAGDAGPDYLTKHGVSVVYVEGPQDPR